MIERIFRTLRPELGKLKRRLFGQSPTEPVSPFLSCYPPGHYYSPLPSSGDFDEFEKLLAGEKARREIPGIDLRVGGQKTWVENAITSFGPLPVGQSGQAATRYSATNPFFEYSDAWTTYAMLRHFEPERVIEVGSGYSSALMLDIDDQFRGGTTQFTFVEPFPERLFGLLREADHQRCEILVHPVQDVPLEVFSRLKPNDILFIDSSHVSKVGSDVNFLFHEVLPLLSPGVVVHVHDVLWPFEYPISWLREGRAWNEAYLLRSFLQFNRDFEILAFNAYLGECEKELFSYSLPGFLAHPGGSFWMRRV